MQLDRRLQILIDEPRYRRLVSRARERETSVAAVIREAIDLALPDDLESKRAAAERILAAEPMPVPDLAGLKAELDTLRSGGM
ncbi:MAG: antitoxin [Actinobacteria bacterium]|nr:antitoxin [Actinomycetota bacterium]